ncbi:MAG TPA: hypothetical protein VEF36_19095 [Roseiarcus sp.]|nr:hypothetical protein [Roseiarcus sp.]
MDKVSALPARFPFSTGQKKRFRTAGRRPGSVMPRKNGARTTLPRRLDSLSLRRRVVMVVVVVMVMMVVMAVVRVMMMMMMMMVRGVGRRSGVGGQSDEASDDRRGDHKFLNHWLKP